MRPALPGRAPEAALALLVCLLSALTLQAPGTTDVGIFEAWSRLLPEHGVRGTLERANDNYPPLTFVILEVIRRLAAAAGASTFLGLKVALLAAVYATSVLFYWWTRELVATLVLQLVMTLTIALGYLDAFWVTLLVPALWALQRERYVAFGLLFTAAVMIKPQPLLLAPFLALYVADLRRPSGSRPGWVGNKAALARAAGASLALLALLLAFFGPHTLQPLFNSLDTFGRSWTGNRVLSGYALNLNWVLTHALHVWDPAQFGPLEAGLARNIVNPPPIYQVPQKILFAAVFLALLWRYARGPRTFGRVLVYGTAGELTYFMLNTGVHENHLILAPVVLAVAAAFDRRRNVAFLTWSLAASANLIVFYGFAGEAVYPRFIGVDAALLFALALVACYAIFLLHDLRESDRADG